MRKSKKKAMQSVVQNACFIDFNFLTIEIERIMTNSYKLNICKPQKEEAMWKY